LFYAFADIPVPPFRIAAMFSRYTCRLLVQLITRHYPQDAILGGIVPARLSAYAYAISYIKKASLPFQSMRHAFPGKLRIRLRCMAGSLEFWKPSLFSVSRAC